MYVNINKVYSWSSRLTVQRNPIATLRKTASCICLVYKMADFLVTGHCATNIETLEGFALWCGPLEHETILFSADGGQHTTCQRYTHNQNQFSRHLVLLRRALIALYVKCSLCIPINYPVKLRMFTRCLRSTAYEYISLRSTVSIISIYLFKEGYIFYISFVSI